MDENNNETTESKDINVEVIVNGVVAIATIAIMAYAAYLSIKMTKPQLYKLTWTNAAGKDWKHAVVPESELENYFGWDKIEKI